MDAWLINGRYRVLREIATRPRNRIFFAEDRRGSAPVVIKIWTEASDSPSLPSTTLIGVEHPHLIPILDAGRIAELSVEATADEPDTDEAPLESPPRDGSVFTVMPWCSGGDVFRAIGDQLDESPSTEELSRWLSGITAQIASALRYLHDHSLLHFDVAPRNILLHPDPAGGELPHARLIDLELIDRDSTPLGTRVRGTFPYIAPEVLQATMVDPRADLFSLGASLYHSLDRLQLIEELGRDRVSNLAEEGRLPPIASRVANLSPEWCDRITRLLSVDPAGRPSSAAELLEELERGGELPDGFSAEQPIHWAPERPVGLEKEFDYLLREIEKLRLGESRSSLILIGGESGIGRRAVARRLQERARLEGIRTVSAICHGPLEAPLEPIAALLERLQREPRVAAEDRSELTSLVRWLRGASPNGDRVPPLTAVSEERARLFGRIGTVLERVAGQSGTLLIVEDVHRAAPELHEILGIISHRLQSQRDETVESAGLAEGTANERGVPRMLFLCTYDDHSLDAAGESGLAELARHPEVSRIALKPLTRARARQVVQTTLGRSHLPAPVIDALHQLSGGKTRPLIELLRECWRQGSLRQDRAGWSWVGDADAAQAIPAARAAAFRELPADDRTLLSLVELAGGPIDRELLVGAGHELGIDDAADRVASLEGTGWVKVIPTGRFLRLELPLPPANERPADAREGGAHALALGRALYSRSPEDPIGPAQLFLRAQAWDTLAGALPDTLDALHSRLCFATLAHLVDEIEASAPERYLPDEALRMRIEALRDLGRDEEALERTDEWLARQRDGAEISLDLLAMRGDLLHRLGRLPAARQELEDALDLITPDTPAETRSKLRVTLSRVLRSEGVTDRAHTLALLAVEDGQEEDDLDRRDLISEVDARLELASSQRARGWNERAAEWLEAFLEERREELPAPRIAQLHYSIAEIEFGRGRHDAAMYHWRQCLPIERKTLNYSRLAKVVVALGRVAYTRGDRPRATRLHLMSLKLHEQIGDRQGLAQVLNNIGLLSKMQNKFEAAEACFHRCIGLLQELGPPDDLAGVLGNLSDVKAQQGEFRVALEHALSSLEIRKPLGNRRGIAFAYYRIASIYRDQGELDRAADYGEKALELRRDLGDKHNLVFSQKLLGDLARMRARYYEANRSLRQSLSLSDSLGNRAGRCTLLASIAELDSCMGRIDEAVGHAEEGLEIAEAEGLHTIAGQLYWVLGRARLESGDLSSAEAHLTKAEEIFRRERSRRELAQTLLARTELALELGSLERGWPTLEEAYETIESLGLTDLQPLYYRLRGGLVSSGPQADIPVARRLLERGLEEAIDLDLPEETWRLYRDLARLEDVHGTPEIALEHLSHGAEQLLSIHDQLPAEFQGSFLESGARLEFLSEWRSRKVEPTPAATATEEVPAPPRPRPETVPAVDDLVRLQEVTFLLNSERNLQVLLDRILDEVLSLFGAERGFLILCEGDEHRIRAARDIDQSEVGSPEFKDSHSIARDVAKSGKIFLTNDAQQDRRLRESHSVHDLKLQAIACFPLSWHEELLGVIYIENRFRKQIVPKERLRLLEAFSAQAAQAIANTRLHDELVRRSGELERSAIEIEELNGRLRDRVIEQDRELAEARRTLADQQEQLEERYRFHQLIGSSEEMRGVFRLLDRVSGTHLPVLIEGESGTGKELAARAIHYNSGRSKKPFVTENCGAISESLLESELFGHVKGAFTGAERDHSGLFAAADGGTLFLDEVHQLSMGSQRKLLRVLQEGEFRPVGGKEVIQTDVRVLTASNESLYRLVGEGRFREDLYYRLNVLRVELPPLRKRGRDVMILAQHFLDEVVESQSLGTKQWSPESMRALARYPFPGNVRELRNVVEKAAILGDSEWIGEGDLFFDAESPQSAAPLELPTFLTEVTLKEAREEFQKRYVESMLTTVDGVVSHAAERSGITRESFHRLLRKYNVRR